MSTNDYYILGCLKRDSIDDIKSKYKKLLLKSHPDKGGTAEQFQKIQEAFENIKNSHGTVCKRCNGKLKSDDDVCLYCAKYKNTYKGNEYPYQKKCKRCSNIMHINIKFDECFECRFLNMCKTCGKPVNNNKTDFCVNCVPKCNMCGKAREVIYFRHCRECRLTKCQKCGRHSNTSVCNNCQLNSESSETSSSSSETSKSSFKHNVQDEKAYTPGTKFSSDGKTADYKPPSQEQKKKSSQKCSKCKQTGHNKRSCKYA